MSLPTDNKGKSEINEGLPDKHPNCSIEGTNGNTDKEKSVDCKKRCSFFATICSSLCTFSYSSSENYDKDGEANGPGAVH